jgi:hypothetical protein
VAIVKGAFGCRKGVSEYVVPYCFGDITDAERDAFEQHLLTCASCWEEVERLEATVRILRTEQTLKQALVSPDVLGVFGMSGRLDLPMGGHRGFAVLASVLYALLFAVPVLVEIAYQFDVYGRTALMLAPGVFLWILATTVLALWVDVHHSREFGRGFLRSLGVLLAATASLCLVLAPWFPAESTVAANFQTYTARAGYFKSVVYAWLVFLPFVLWPFHFVVTCQHELRKGHYKALLALLTGQRPAVAPRGTLYPRFVTLALYLVLLSAVSYVGVNHMFENLHPGPYMNLFMGLVMTRVITWLSLGAAALAWYAMMLNELKRECLILNSTTEVRPSKVLPQRV